jgi:hypothetical protein
MWDRGSSCVVGAEYLSSSAIQVRAGASQPEWRGYYFEVEVQNEAGRLFVGLAGTNLGTNCTGLGDDECSWGVRMYNGFGNNGCACALGGCVREGRRSGKLVHLGIKPQKPVEAREEGMVCRISAFFCCR